MLHPVSALNNSLIPQPKRLRLFSPLGVFLLVIAMVVGFFMAQLLGIYVSGKWLLPAADTLSSAEIFLIGGSDGTVFSTSIMISCILLTALIMLIIRVKGGNIQRYLSLQSFAPVIGIGMVGLLLLFVIGNEALTYLLAKDPSAFVDPLYESVSSVWLLMLALVIVAPLYEELVFRGLLWSAIAEQFSVRKPVHTSVSITISTSTPTSVSALAPIAGQSSMTRRGMIVASIVTSLIFAAIHLQYDLYEMSTIVPLALLFCYARVKSGSLLLPIGLHMINNGIAMGLYLSQVS